jgi:hypothetical protein
MAILIVLKEFFAAIALVHDMVDGTGILKTELARHGAGSARNGRLCQKL